MLNKYDISNKLALHSLSLEQAEVLLDTVNNNRQLLGKYLYWVKEVNDLASATEYIRKRLDSDLPYSKWYYIEQEQQLLGIFGIKSVSDSGIAEIGYWLSKDAQGKGITNKIINKLPDMLTSTPAKMIEFCCLRENNASRAVAEKAGADLVKIIPDYLTIDDMIQDLLVFHLPVAALSESGK